MSLSLDLSSGELNIECAVRLLGLPFDHVPQLLTSCSVIELTVFNNDITTTTTMNTNVV